MFSSQKVETYVQSCKFHGDAEKPSLQIAFYVPLTHELCYEIDDRIARQIFHKEGKNHVPVAELDDVVFKLGEIGAHNIEFYPHNAEGADGAGQMVAACSIGKVEASKLFADKNEWTLIFHATLPMDSHSIELARKYYRNKVWLTLEKMQDDLIDAKADGKPKPIILNDSEVECPVRILCVTCNETAQSLGEDMSGWCDLHVQAAVGVMVRRIRYAEGAEA